MSAIALGVDRTVLELRMYTREKEAVFFSFLFPILLLALFSLIFSGQFEGAAAETGMTAGGFFLPGILQQIALVVLAVVSLAIGRPYVGYVLAALDPKYAHWRESRPLRRAMAKATVLWGLIFAIRAIVQGFLYLNDRVGWLATAKIAMGWPLFAAGLAVVVSRWGGIRGTSRRRTPWGTDGPERPAARRVTRRCRA